MRKHLLTTAICAAAAVAMGSFAYAGTTLESLGTRDNVRGWVDNTNLLEMYSEDGGEVLADLDGNVLTEKSYRRVGYDSQYGFLTVILEPEDGVNGVGAVNLSGQEVVPCTYGEIDFENEHWIEAIVLNQATADQYDYQALLGDGYYLIDHVDFYYAGDDGSVTQAGSLARDQYLDSHAYGNYINIENRSDGSVTAYDSTWTPVETPEPLKYVYDEAPGADDQVISFYENGQYGLKDAAGNVILPATFGSIYSFDGDYAKVVNRLESGEVYGLIDKTGTVVVPVEFEDIDRAFYGPATAENGYSSYAYNNCGYYAVVKDHKLGYVDENGTVTCDFTIAEDNCENNGASATYTDMGGAMHILAADGTDTDVSQYENVRAMYGGSGMYYSVTDADYNYGVIDWHGNVIVEVKYNEVDLSGDGQYLLVQEDYNSPCELLKLTYTPDNAPAQTDAQDAGTSLAVAEDPDAAQEPQDAPAADAAAPADGAEDFSVVAGLIDSAITLANSDAAANKDAIISVLSNAADALAQSKPEVKTVIDSAITLMNSDSIDGASVATVLNSAKALLGL